MGIFRDQSYLLCCHSVRAKPKNMPHVMLVSTATSRLSFSGDGAAASCWRPVWNPADVGVPVLVVDTGRGRRRRRLHVVLADAQTGFPRWRDAVDHLSDYRCTAVGVHTLRQSTDHARLAAISFRDHDEAERFVTELSITPSLIDPTNLNHCKLNKMIFDGESSIVIPPSTN